MGSGAPLHLTFDDGPGPEGTRAVLEALASADARATFFVLGERVRAHPDLLGEIHAAGHRIELHGDAHLDHRIIGTDALAADTDRAIDALRASGVEPVWWRLPWGRPGPATAEIARRRGLRIVGWDVDTHDWRGDGAGDQPTSFERAARQGGVVLMHDGFGPGATRTGIENTVALTAAVMRIARESGTPVLGLPEPDAPAGRRVPAGAAPEPEGPTSAPDDAEAPAGSRVAA